MDNYYNFTRTVGVRLWFWRCGGGQSCSSFAADRGRRPGAATGSGPSGVRVRTTDRRRPLPRRFEPKRRIIEWLVQAESQHVQAESQHMMKKRAKVQADTDKPIRKPAEPLPPWFESGRGTGFLTRRDSKSTDSGRGRHSDRKIAASDRLRRISRSR